MNSSTTRLLVFGAAFLAILWLPGGSRASLLDLDADETGSLFPLPTEYLVGNLRDRVLGPFDPFWWSDSSSNQGKKTNDKKRFQRWQSVTLVMSQWTELHEQGSVAEPRSGADSGSSGGGGGGSRTGQADRTSSSLTTNSQQWLSYDYPANIPDSSNSYSYSAETTSVATPLPPSLLLFGSGLVSLIALGRKYAFFRNCVVADGRGEQNLRAASSVP